MKRTVIDCDKCKKEDVSTVEISFYCGHEFNGVERVSDYKKKDLCITCMKLLFNSTLDLAQKKYDDEFQMELLKRF